MKEIQVIEINKEDEIFNSLSLCSSALFNQDINNEETLKKLSHKYAENGVCYVVSVGGVVSGFVACYVNDRETFKGFLSIIVIKKEYQGLGLGALLLDVVFATCKQETIRELLLEVDSNNDLAIKFYKRRGFIIKESKSPNTIILSKPLLK